MNISKNILITGCAGFIGFSLANSLLKDGFSVTGIDSVTDYYSKNLKKKRLSNLRESKNFKFIQKDINQFNFQSLKNKPNFIVHLAAQPGVRHSIENPRAYIEGNVLGFFNILEYARNNNSKLIYASSSSVYGDSSSRNINEDNKSVSPKSFYGLTKKINEDLAKIYYYNYEFKSVGLRFFTVYGNWGRPDMSYWKFTKNIIENKPITINGSTEISRDFTHIEDVTESIKKIIYQDTIKENLILNISSSQNRTLGDMIGIIEKLTQKNAKILFSDYEKGDVLHTSANNSLMFDKFDFSPKISLEQGLHDFLIWFKRHYNEDYG